MERHYSKEEVRAAVDIVIGDDGFRSKEVIEVLNTFDEEKEKRWNRLARKSLKILQLRREIKLH